MSDIQRKFQKELNAGTVSLVLLGLLKRQGRPMYGYEIAKLLETAAEGSLPMNQGALYPVLRSLDKQGLVTSRVEPSVSGPPRRYYRITPAGAQAFTAWSGVWNKMKRLVDAFAEVGDEHRTGQRGSNVSGGTRTPAKTAALRRARRSA